METCSLGPDDEIRAWSPLLSSCGTFGQFSFQLAPDPARSIDAHTDQSGSARKDATDRRDADILCFAVGNHSNLTHIQEHGSAHKYFLRFERNR